MTDVWKRTIRDLIFLILGGFAYYLFNRFTGLGIPCAFHEITGLPCPSCGISHMFIHLFSLDFKSAFYDNQFLFFTWPLIAIEIVYLFYRTLESKKDLPRWNFFAIIIFGTLLGIFGVLRIICHSY